MTEALSCAYHAYRMGSYQRETLGEKPLLLMGLSMVGVHLYVLLALAHAVPR